MKADVFFISIKDSESTASIARKSVQLLQASHLEDIFQPNQIVAVKQHFGEYNAGHHVKPPITAKLVAALAERRARPFITDTSTLYRGGRADGLAYAQLVHNHGFTQEAIGAPFIPADGLRGADGVKIDIDGKHFKQVGIASAVYHADTVLVLTHVTGHCNAAIGAAMKNVGMGMATRAGKMLQHCDAKPKEDHDKCIACEACVRWCPTDAITLTKRSGRQYATIDRKICIGCGECVSVCPTGAVNIAWLSEGSVLCERMAEHALGFAQAKRGKAVYFNYATEITRNCDCARPEKPALTAVGIIAGTDMLACDQATIDMIDRKAGSDFFTDLWPDFDWKTQLEYAEKIGLGTRDYNLIEL